MSETNLSRKIRKVCKLYWDDYFQECNCWLFKFQSCFFFFNKVVGVFSCDAVGQRSWPLLWCGFSLWPMIFHMLQLQHTYKKGLNLIIWLHFTAIQNGPQCNCRGLQMKELKDTDSLWKDILSETPNQKRRQNTGELWILWHL